MRRLPLTPYSHFKRLRTLAVAAFACTLAMTIAIWVGSLMPGAESYKQTQSVETELKEVLNVDETTAVLPTSITCALKDYVEDSKIYTGSTFDLSLNFYPSNVTEKAVTYKSNNSAITVSESGKITCKKRGTAKITVSSSANPKVFGTLYVTCDGINPSLLQNLRFNMADTVKVGEKLQVALVNDAGKFPLIYSTPSVSGEAATYSNVGGHVFGLKPGSVTLTVKADDVTVTKTIQVVENSDFVMPASLSTENNISITVGDLTTINVSSLPEGSPEYFVMSSNNSSVASISGGIIIAKGVGECIVTVTSLFDNNVKTEISVKVLPVMPEKLYIVGNDRVQKNNQNKFYCRFSNEPTDTTVVWTLVEGKGYVDGNGNFTPSKTGTATLRATSVADPSVYAEKTVTVSSFASFYMVVRKMFGHFSLFAILGFGLAFTFILLAKPYWLSPVYSLLTAFAVAGISEIFQLPVFSEGRYCTWKDVGIDMLGALSGMAIALTLIALACTIWYFANRDSFKRMLISQRTLSFKTALKKSGGIIDRL